MKGADTGKTMLAQTEGREALASFVERTARTETEAIGELESVASHMK